MQLGFARGGDNRGPKSPLEGELDEFLCLNLRSVNIKVCSPGHISQTWRFGAQASGELSSESSSPFKFN